MSTWGSLALLTLPWLRAPALRGGPHFLVYNLGQPGPEKPRKFPQQALVPAWPLISLVCRWGASASRPRPPLPAYREVRPHIPIQLVPEDSGRRSPSLGRG